MKALALHLPLPLNLARNRRRKIKTKKAAKEEDSRQPGLIIAALAALV
jgi:hypothetical protein